MYIDQSSASALLIRKQMNLLQLYKSQEKNK